MSPQYRHTVLTLCTLAFFATMVARLTISPVLPDITGWYGVSDSAAGLALTGMWASYALTQFPSGLLGDRFGERRVILLALGLTATAAVLLAFAGSFALFVLFAVALGAGAGLHYSVATTLLSKQFDQLGRAIGVHIAGGPLAGLVTPVVAVALATRFGWRVAVLSGALVALSLFALFAHYVRPTAPTHPGRPVRAGLDLDAIGPVLSRPEIRYSAFLAACGAFSWQATASFLPTFLIEYRGLTQASAGVLFSLYFVVHGATQPVMGWLSDRLTRDAAAALTMGLGVVGFGWLVAGSSLLAAVGAVLCLGPAMSWGAPVQSRVMDNLTLAERGSGFGLVRTMYMSVGALGSVAVGVVADTGGWALAFVGLALLLLVALASLGANRLFALGY